MALFSHPSALDHDPGAGHPERAERVEAVLRTLKDSGLGDRLDWLEAPVADRDTLKLVHDADYLDELEQMDLAGGGWIDRDTRLGPRSLEAVLRVSGGTVEAVRGVLERRWTGAFVVMRPPGHHAPAAGPASRPSWSRSRPTMGFCVLNHVALGARWAISSGGARRVAILDWDAHHGNGTQDIFWTDPEVLYASLHQFPFYPGTGEASETGKQEGAGLTVNVPLPAGTAEDAYARAMDEIVVPAIAGFEPDLIMISAGYDAHVRDPVCMMRLTAGAFFRFTRMVAPIAPIVGVLEGGYDLDALGWGVAATVSALLDDALPAGVPDAELGSLQGSADAMPWVDRAAGYMA